MPSKKAFKTYGEPNINSGSAVPYKTWSICWQDRVRKETYRQMNPDKLYEALTVKLSLPRQRSPELDRRSEHSRSLGSFPVERFPIGGRNDLNNNSRDMRLSFGPSSWDASGGLSSMHRTTHGRPNRLPGPGAATMGANCRRAADVRDNY
eukprot:TRINITY_DN57036_c0_g1_i1.p1 TRINITY_DN57036_c0_g1~~TRINITY_DN57036_c0_g1_i1.p1  ORF type:complete len:150 (+),score=20.98 TRINITY_DN57036_c0_g1_i1:117-566(+)